MSHRRRWIRRGARTTPGAVGEARSPDPRHQLARSATRATGSATHSPDPPPTRRIRHPPGRRELVGGAGAATNAAADASESEGWVQRGLVGGRHVTALER